MSFNDIAIKVDGVSKAFKLPHEKKSSVKSMFVGLFNGKRTYQRQQVLKDVSFEIKKGEFFGIVGRNGSGKSTLLKLLAQIYAPDTGHVQINGKLTPFIELGVGFNPELTGRENVYLNGALLGFNRKEMDAMYDEIVEFAELKDFMDQKLKNYSSGMQVRLAFSIAIRAETDILLIDEVLAVGDQSFQEKCYKYFTRIKQTDKTVVFVTHDMGSVERFCDRVLLLDKSQTENGIYPVREAVTQYNQLNHPVVEAEDDETIPDRKKGDMYIKDVKLLNSAGKSVRKFNHGDALTIRVKVERSEAFAQKPYVVGLAFHDQFNIGLAGPNSLQAKLPAGKDTVEYRLPHIPFNMGEYYLTVGLFDEFAAQRYDWIDKGVTFFVNTSDTEYGKVILEGTWKSL